MRWLKTCLGGVLLAVMIPTVGFAMEPGNDTAPWKWSSGVGDATMYTAKTEQRASWGGFEQIKTTSDNDHVLMGCNGRKVTHAIIRFKHASGDIDLYVYDIAGNLLGSSGGVSDVEEVDVSAFNKQQVVLKVYGYNGALGWYDPEVMCP